MATGATRDDEALRAGLEAWYARLFPTGNRHITAFSRAATGWSSENLFVEVAEPAEAVVVRLPSLVPSFPTPQLREQAAALTALADREVPVPGLVAVEDDPQWLGGPFLVMTRVAGRPAGEVPALDPWLKDAPIAFQRGVHEAFFEALAALHRVDWPTAGLDATLRVGVAAELTFWRDYIAWSTGNDAPRVLVDALAWCTKTAPPADGPQSMLWGDARLGNVIYNDDGTVVALLDWELATIGPAEMDLAWYLVLDALVSTFVDPLPGFLARDAAIAFYERALGRPVQNLEWHEIFALVRSIAINDCQARLAAQAGIKYPGIPGDDNPMLRVLSARIEAFEER
jgi:aminoglycoside phosphotransferase (APT) family kinase protein